MSSSKAERLILSRLGSAGTVLLSVHLALPDVPAWADGQDGEGCAVVLVGAHALRSGPEGEAAVQAVLAGLAEGNVPEGVHAVAYAPKASQAIAAIVADAPSNVVPMHRRPASDRTEVLADGPRGSGKTQLVPAALAILAELHARAGHALPLRALWLHDSLKNASVKTGRSLEQAMWASLWQIHSDRAVAAFSVGGVEMVTADFVGVQDATSGDRARAECHVLAAEELVPSLDESGGIEERKYELALTSMRLPTRRKVAVCTTNPGDVTTWPYMRWIEGGGRPGCVRRQVPASDRLSPDDVAALREAFRESPDLQKRLAEGEWSALQLGEQVAHGFDATMHVAAAPFSPSPNYALVIGWDGGHSPSAVIGQLVNGQVRIYASLNDLKVGVLELIEDHVLPWLVQHAPWTRPAGTSLISVIDPSMATGSEQSIRASSERTIRDTLAGRVVKGGKSGNAWSPRREAVLRVLAPRTEAGVVPLQISPTRDTALLRMALSSRWYYPRRPDGQVDRSGPKKPNSPWADVGDAFAYLCTYLRPGTGRDLALTSPNRPRVHMARQQTARELIDNMLYRGGRRR